MKKKKIGLVVHYLAYGGLAKATANLSIALDKVGFSVCIITVYKDVAFDYSGSLINMGLYKSENNNFFNRLKRLFILKRKIKDAEIDVFIDLRTRTSYFKEYLINRLLYNQKVIYTIRNADYNKYVCYDSIKFNKLVQKSLGLVTVSKWIRDEFVDNLGFKNVDFIYNPLDFDSIQEKSKERLNFNHKYILAVGQMNNSLKGFEDLLESYAKSNAIENQIYLIILGGGKLLKQYKLLAQTLNIDRFVIFEGISKNPFKYYKNAEFFVLSSRNEGFPNVIIESLACSTPVVSYDCKSGPSEIIIHEKNGLLVKDQDKEELTKALNRFVKDTRLKEKCKLNTISSVSHLTFENIGKQWRQYLNKVIK